MLKKSKVVVAVALMVSALLYSYLKIFHPAPTEEEVAAEAEWVAAVEAERKGPPSEIPAYLRKDLQEAIERRHWDREAVEGKRCWYCKSTEHVWGLCGKNPKANERERYSVKQSSQW